jgi:hypothetical protein
MQTTHAWKKFTPAAKCDYPEIATDSPFIVSVKAIKRIPPGPMERFVAGARTLFASAPTRNEEILHEAFSEFDRFR